MLASPPARSSATLDDSPNTSSSSDLADLSLSNMNFHFNYPSPVKPSLLQPSTSSNSLNPSENDDDQERADDDDGQPTLRRTTKGLEKSVTGFSPGLKKDQERKERSARLLAGRNGASGGDGTPPLVRDHQAPREEGHALISRPRAMDRVRLLLSIFPSSAHSSNVSQRADLDPLVSCCV